jgi:hypothetical protein
LVKVHPAGGATLRAGADEDHPIVRGQNRKVTGGCWSALGHNAKYSSRVDVFRFGPELGHCSTRSALRICAPRSDIALFNSTASAARARRVAGDVFRLLARPARRSAVSFSSPTAPPQKCFQPNCVKNQSFSAPSPNLERSELARACRDFI